MITKRGRQSSNNFTKTLVPKFVVKNQQFHLPETKEKFIPITEEQVKIIEPKQKITEPKSKPTEPRSKSPKKAVGLTKNKSNKKIKMA